MKVPGLRMVWNEALRRTFALKKGYRENYELRNFTILTLLLKRTSVSCIKFCSHSKKQKHGGDANLGAH
jgi:hypothetical protein